VAAKGEHRSWIWPRIRRRLLAGVALALVPSALPVHAQKKAPPAPETKPRGAIVEFQETRQSSILYHEESGGMVLKSGTPVADERDEAKPNGPRMATKAEEGATSTGTGINTSARRTAQRRDTSAAK